MIEKLEILDKEGWVLKGANALIQFKINELVDRVNFQESLFDKQVEINKHQIELWQGLQKAAEGEDNNA